MYDMYNIYNTHTYTSSLYLCYRYLQIYRISTEQMGNIIFANKNDDVRKMRVNIKVFVLLFLKIDNDITEQHGAIFDTVYIGS